MLSLLNVLNMQACFKFCVFVEELTLDCEKYADSSRGRAPPVSQHYVWVNMDITAPPDGPLTFFIRLFGYCPLIMHFYGVKHGFHP